eukprot:5170298-Amphidinium_carterae.1
MPITITDTQETAIVHKVQYVIKFAHTVHQRKVQGGRASHVQVSKSWDLHPICHASVHYRLIYLLMSTGSPICNLASPAGARRATLPIRSGFTPSRQSHYPGSGV